ncbi:LysE family transporter [Lacibacterium aquatile]|uniref:LysE family transporter n=1 Tax=Lacibacterium aquatile TaxID=1168082 RepID=A0ABW5DX93_9PROT
MSVYLPILLSIFTLNMMACISPGPNFLTVSGAAVKRSRGHAVATALGIMTGDTLWAIGAVIGLSALLEAVPSLQTVLRIGGGLYLAYVGWCLWRYAGQGVEAVGRTSGFFPAMMVSLTNPKAPIYLASTFGQILVPGTPGWVLVGAVVTVTGASFVWYVTVAFALSNPAAQRTYQRFAVWIDRVTGSLLIVFGAWLVAG